MKALADLAGSWRGINAFRLMPNDVQHQAPATAEVSVGAGGHLTSIAYTWKHPDDDAQEGLLALGSADGNGVTAFWGDSWHQSPAPAVLTGSFDDGKVSISYFYAEDWRWWIILDASTPEALDVRMENVIPPAAGTGELPAGPYSVMSAELHRA